MQTIRELTAALGGASRPEWLRQVYGGSSDVAAQRLLALMDSFCNFFGADRDTAVCLFSTPGRTELGGNHTDHQRGHVLASAVDLDTIACVRPNSDGVIRIKSAGHHMAQVDLTQLAPRAEETGSSPSLVRGIAARFARLGRPIGGFDAYTTTQVLRGSGLSSSAAFEVLVGTILNHLCGGSTLSPLQLAQIGQWAENHYFGKPCGLMDQMACAIGGVVAIDFGAGDDPAVEQVQFDLHSAGYALCIVDSGADHADLTEDYAAIPREMRDVAACFGRELLSQVSPEEFFAALPAIRSRCGDRALLRAIHYFSDDALVSLQRAAIAAGDTAAFLSMVRRSGRSSWMHLQNVSTCRDPSHQDTALLLAVADRLLGSRGACRIHGGGFAGTIQAFVPLELVETFRTATEQIAGEGACHVLSFRNTGTCCLTD